MTTRAEMQLQPRRLLVGRGQLQQVPAAAQAHSGQGGQSPGPSVQGENGEGAGTNRQLDHALAGRFQA